MRETKPLPAFRKHQKPLPQNLTVALHASVVRDPSCETRQERTKTKKDKKEEIKSTIIAYPQPQQEHVKSQRFIMIITNSNRKRKMFVPSRLLVTAAVLLLAGASCQALTNTRTPPIIPITVLSGFLGSGKTTLLQELLQNKQGLRIGVIVNDVASVNIDSKLVAGKTTTGSGDSYDDTLSNHALADGMVELQNGCACCSLSDELLSSVANLVTLSDLRGQSSDDDDDDKENDNQGFHHIVIELSGVADPKAIRAKFQEAAMEQMPLMERVQLDTMVSLIDCSTFESHFRSTSLATPDEMPELFGESAAAPEDIVEEEEWMKELPPKLLESVLKSLRGTNGMDGEPEGVADLLTSQTETADVLILNKQDLVTSPRELQQLQDIVRALNPRAQIRTTSYGKIPLEQVLGVAEGLGVAVAGAVDDHRDYVQAALLSAKTTIAPNEEACHEPDCTDPSHSHSHSHDHDNKKETMEAQDCADPGCSDPSHSHSHSHSHDKKAATASDESSCADPGCTDPSHSHSHSHSHDAASCGDSECTDPTHDHSHSHNHAAAQETTFVGIGSFVYRARRPFHPSRLISFLRYLPVIRGVPEEEETDDNDTGALVAVPKEAQEALSNCVRSKGFCWCANSHTDALYWSHAGSSYELNCLGQWWATLPRDQWPPGVEEYVLQDFDEAAHDDATNPVGVGDRRQELVFIGPTLGDASSQTAITKFLDQCLLTDEEMEEYAALAKDSSSSAERLPSRFANALDAKYVAY